MLVGHQFPNFTQKKLAQLFNYISINLPFTVLNTSKYLGWVFFGFCKK